MSLISDMHARFTADTDIYGETSTRLYDNRAAQAPTLPYIVLTEISAVREPQLRAASGMVQKRVQVDVYASSSTGVRRLSEYVRDSLDGYRGTMGSTVVRSCHLDGESDFYEPPDDGSSGGKCRRIMEFVIFHTETVPTF